MNRVWLGLVLLAATCPAAHAQVTKASMQAWRDKHPRVYECSPNLVADQKMDNDGVIHVIEVCPTGAWHKTLTREQYVAWKTGRMVRPGRAMSDLSSRAAEIIGPRWPQMDVAQRKAYYCEQFPQYFAIPIKTQVDQMDMEKARQEYAASGCSD